MGFRDYSSSYQVLQEIILGLDVDACLAPLNLGLVLAGRKRLEKKNHQKLSFMPGPVITRMESSTLTAS